MRARDLSGKNTRQVRITDAPVRGMTGVLKNAGFMPSPAWRPWHLTARCFKRTGKGLEPLTGTRNPAALSTKMVVSPTCHASPLAFAFDGFTRKEGPGFLTATRRRPASVKS